MFPSRVTELVVTRGTIGYQKKTWRKSVDLYKSLGTNRLATKPSQSEFYYSNLQNCLTNGQILPKPKTIPKPGKFKLFLMCDRIQNSDKCILLFSFFYETGSLCTTCHFASAYTGKKLFFGSGSAELRQSHGDQGAMRSPKTPE